MKKNESKTAPALNRSRIFISLSLTAVLILSLASLASAADKWELLTTPAPTPFLDVMLLMPDGSVMILSANDNQTWVKLTPDAYGNYVNGTWSTVGPMNIPRLYFASEVLPDGRVWVTGGEYTGPYYDSNITGSGEIYDPTTNKWTWTANFPICQPSTAANPTGARTVNVHSDVVLTTGSPVVNGIYSTDRIKPGWTVTGAGIPAGSTVVSVDSPSSVTISNNATASGPSAAVLFRGKTTSCFGDEPSVLLPGGTSILGGSIFTNTPYAYSLPANTWTASATKTHNDRTDEEGWAVMGDGRVMDYDLFTSVANNSGYAELYNPVGNFWTSISPADGSANGTLPVLSSTALGFELGPLLRLQDGRMIVIGANQHTALYTPSTNTWAPGPDMLGPLSNPFGTINNAKFGADDAPAAALPNGHLIIGTDAGANPVVLSSNTTAGSPTVTVPSTAGLQVGWGVAGSAVPGGTSIASVDTSTQLTLSANAKTTTTSNLTYGGVFSSPMLLFDFNPANGKMSPMNVPDPNLPFIPAFITRMLVLPTGQLLFNDSSNQPWVMTPDGEAPTSALPVITKVVANGGGSYTLTGTQLNGQSAGAAYGDDAQMNENYPIVRLQTALPHNAICNSNAANCRVYYARSSNWSSVAVDGGSTPETVNFTLPAGIPSGQYLLTVTGAGISSAPVAFTVP